MPRANESDFVNPALWGKWKITEKPNIEVVPLETKEYLVLSEKNIFTAPFSERCGTKMKSWL
jgi:hypothetical protein